MTMNLDKLRKIISEEIIRRRPLQEGLSKKDFIAMAQQIRASRASDRPVLIDFAIRFAKTQSIRFDEKRFRNAIETGKGI
jgi:hypothetical protein